VPAGRRDTNRINTITCVGNARLRRRQRFGRSTASCTSLAIGAHGGVFVVAIGSIVIKGGQQGHVLDRSVPGSLDRKSIAESGPTATSNVDSTSQTRRPAIASTPRRALSPSDRSRLASAV